MNKSVDHPVYRQVLGSSFDQLPASVRRLHDLTTPTTWSGRAHVTRGTSLLARLFATIAGLPPAGPDQSLIVEFAPDTTGELWTRKFGSRRFVSHQSARGDVISEKVGLVTLRVQPRLTQSPAASTSQNSHGLIMVMIGASILGVPLPSVFVPRISTREFEQDGRYHFDVSAHMSILGLLVHYEGCLEQIA